MAFKKGNKLSTGRPKDSLSKRSLKFADAIMESGVDLVAELIGALNNAKDSYKKAEDNRDLQMMAVFNSQITNNAEKMLPYVYPKLSSIEVKPMHSLEQMSPQERLESLKEVVKVLESKKDVGE